MRYKGKKSVLVGLEAYPYLQKRLEISLSGVEDTMREETATGNP